MYFDIYDKQFKPFGNMLQERSSNGAFQALNAVYIFAGWNMSGEYLRTVERHNITPGGDFEEINIDG